MRRKAKEMALIKAVQAGCLSVVQHLVIVEKMDINTRNSEGLNLLQIAICKGHNELTKWLINEGIIVDTADTRGWSALHDAVLYDLLDVAMLLLEKGADPTASSRDDLLAIDLVEYGSPLYNVLSERILQCTCLNTTDLSGEIDVL